MDRNFVKASTSPDLGKFISFECFVSYGNICHVGSSENSGNMYSLSHMSLLPSVRSTLSSAKIYNEADGSEYRSFFHDEFSFSRPSTMARW
jgi:hypothetical protein